MSSKRYVKKKIVVHAEPYKLGLEDGLDTLGVAITNGLNSDTYVQPKCTHFKGVPFIETLEGKHYVSEGDYIITGVKGERYPCKKDIFEMTYEEVDESANTTIYVRRAVTNSYYKGQMYANIDEKLKEYIESDNPVVRIKSPYPSSRDIDNDKLVIGKVVGYSKTHIAIVLDKKYDYLSDIAEKYVAVLVCQVECNNTRYSNVSEVLSISISQSKLYTELSEYAVSVCSKCHRIVSKDSVHYYCKKCETVVCDECVDEISKTSGTHTYCEHNDSDTRINDVYDSIRSILKKYGHEVPELNKSYSGCKLSSVQVNNNESDSGTVTIELAYKEGECFAYTK